MEDSLYTNSQVKSYDSTNSKFYNDDYNKFHNSKDSDFEHKEVNIKPNISESFLNHSPIVGNFENSKEDNFNVGIIVRVERNYSVAWSLLHGLMSISCVNYVRLQNKLN